MKQDKKEFLGTYRKVRKPMPPSEKVIPSEKEIRKSQKFDWRKELEDDGEDGEDYRSISDDNQ